MVFKRVFKTLFPRFDDPDDTTCEDSQGVPGLEALSDSSYDGDGSLSSGEQNKLDEDVAMFMSLVGRMQVKSLLFILQNHVKEMHNIPEYQLKQALEGSSMRQEKVPLTVTTTSKRLTVVKKCRFAEIMGGQKIRATVHEIPKASMDEKDDLWWSKDDMKRMKLEARKVVRVYRRSKPDFAESVLMLAESYKEDTDEILVDHHMKKLTKESYTRGLEPHIVDSLGQCRTEIVQIVLQEQEKILKARQRKSSSSSVSSSSLSRQGSNRRLGRDGSLSKQGSNRKLDLFSDDDEKENREAQDRLRRCYREASLPCRTLAAKMAECDHVEALKASMSRWGPPKSAWQKS